MVGIPESQKRYRWHTPSTVFGEIVHRFQKGALRFKSSSLRNGKEFEYRLIKELWAHDGSRIAVRFAYEWRDADGNWFRSYGNENWEFDANSLMQLRYASINDLQIDDADRKFHWPQGPRPVDHPSLTELGL
jgi:nuclear transport factor 2 (NTF2) superfamily protein